MCQFLSVIVLRNGDVLHHPMLDSHADLVAYFNLPDAHQYHQHFAKAELTPEDWTNPDTWAWRIDEKTAPGWLADVEAQAEAHTRILARRMILTETSKIPRLIVDGCWIVAGEAVVSDVRGGRIIRVQGSAQVHGVWDSAQVHGVRDSAQVHDVRGSAQVHDVRGSAQVHGVWDSAQVYGVWGSAQVHDVRGSAQVHGVRDSAQVYGVWGSAQVHGVRGSAQVYGVWGSAQVHGVWDSAQVHGVWDSAQVHGVWDSAQVHDVRGSAILDESAKAHLVTQRRLNT